MRDPTMHHFKLYSRYLMGALYCAAGLNHFINPEFYTAIMPPWIPLHLEMVWLSGLAELALGVALFPERTRKAAAWGVIAMLIAFMPVHVHMVANHQQFPDAPLWALWLRLPIQVLLILWAWVYTRPAAPRTDA